MELAKAIEKGVAVLSSNNGRPALLYKGKHLPLTAKQVQELQKENK